MENSQPLEARTATRTFAQFITLGGRISRRTALLSFAAAGVVLGIVFGWNWLVAAGRAPIILALAPCAAMCALGVCAHRLGQKDR